MSQGRKSRHVSLAVSRVTLNHGVIRDRLSASPLGGSAVGETRGFSHGRADAMAARMAVVARINAAGFEQRTGRLVNSVRPIVRHFGKGAGTEIGVGTTEEHGKWLEIGTDFHFIRPRNARFLQSNPSDPIKGPVPDKWELEGKFKLLPHPGNRPYHWMSNAVRTIIPGAQVRVRVLK